DQFWYQGANGMQGHPHTGNHFGFCTQPGDFNADGYDDLAIGIELQEIGTQPNAGAVEVLYGSPTGLQATGTGGPDDQLWSQDSPGVEDKAENGDLFGRSLGAGDYNGDGYGDLVVGSYDEKIASIPEAGAVNVLYGSAAGLQATGTGGPDDQFWFQGENG